jgi:ABC-type dipeptide/oligopeptide/nickel transport system permease component
MLDDQQRKIDKEKHPLDDLFKKHVWLQIYLPLLLVVVAITILVAILWVNQQGKASVWADVSLVMLIIPTFIIGLILLVLLVGVTYGAAYLIGVLPDPFRRMQEIMNQVSDSVERGSKMAAKPVIVPKAAGSAIQAIFTGIISIFKRRPE